MAWVCQAGAGPAIFTAWEAVKLIPSDRNLSIDQNGQHHLTFRLPKTFRRGSVDADPMTWMVTQGMLEREIVKVKKAKAEHSGESAEGAFGVVWRWGVMQSEDFPGAGFRTRYPGNGNGKG
jgi:hypothetical protein